MRASVSEVARGVLAVTGGAWAALVVGLGLDLLVAVTPLTLASRFHVAPNVGTCATFMFVTWSLWRALRGPIGCAAAWVGAVVGLASGVAVPAVALFVTLSRHAQLGTPIFGCVVEGMRAEACVGRDWSFIQDRAGWIHARGVLTESVCESFSNLGTTPVGAPEANANPNPCALSNPRSFTSVDCDETGFRGATRCFHCSHHATTADTYVTEVAWTGSCVSAEVFEGTNLRSTDLHTCRDAILQSDCPRASREIGGAGRGRESSR